MQAPSVKRLEPVAQQGGLYTALKTETMIDRSTGMAAHGSLRNHEMVPAGSKFDLEMSVRVFEGDDPNQLASWTKEALGGSESRGYGWVGLEYAIEGL